jgi:hypothetical protein
MVDDKYIGLMLAVGGSVGIGTSFIVTKKVECFNRRLLHCESQRWLSRVSMQLEKQQHKMNLPLTICRICGIQYGGQEWF